MAKKYIISIKEEELYPFDHKQHFDVMVVRVHPLSSQNQHFKETSEKVRCIMNVSCSSLIQIVRIHEKRGKNFIIDYQYIPDSLIKSNRICQSQFMSSVKEKLYKFTQIIADHHIKTNIGIDNIGLSKEGQPKIFVGLDFQIVPQDEKEMLINEYKAMIDRMMEHNFGFRNSLKAQSEISHTSNKKLIQMQGKLSKLRLRNGHSSQESSNQSCPTNNKKKSKVKKDQNESSTNFGQIKNHLIKPRAQKISCEDSHNRTNRNQDEEMDDSLKKRFTNAYQKTQQTINLYEKYARNSKKH